MSDSTDSSSSYTRAAAPTKAAPPAPPSSSAAPTVTLETFCAARSATDKRVELIGAFHNAEQRAQHLSDTQDNYQARFDAFCSAPA
jgi:cell division septation protein DedD